MDESKFRARYEKNVEFFKQHLPTLGELIDSTTYYPNFVVSPEDNSLNKIENEVPLYQPTALRHAMRECADFLDDFHKKDYRKSPNSIIIGGLIVEKPFRKTIRHYASLYNDHTNKLPSHPNLIILGLGLGYHAEILCNKHIFDRITFIEKDYQCFLDTLYSVNWYQFIKDMGENKTITFIVNNPNKTDDDYFQEIKNHLTIKLPSMMISTVVYHHIGKDEFSEEKKILDDFYNNIRVAYERIGTDSKRFFNNMENVRNGTKILDLSKSKLTDPNQPIAIIGSGPSIDIYLDDLKANRKKLFVISCGSSLASLLKENIKPDLHVELEYQSVVIDLIEDTISNHKILDIPLVMSADCHPEMPKYFSDTFMCFPETSVLINSIPKSHVLRKGGVTCTNAATALASHLTDGPIILIGLDFAYTNNEHHAKSNIANRTNLEGKLKLFEDDAARIKKMATIVVDDVYGNKIWTRAQLLSAKIQMEFFTKYSNHKVYNCSHGAYIEKTTHCEIGQLKDILSNADTRSGVTFEHTVYDHKEFCDTAKGQFDITFDTCSKIKKIVKNIKSQPGAQVGKKIQNLCEDIFQKVYWKDMGLYRQIMGANRLPLLMLYILSSFVEDEKLEEVIDTWYEEHSHNISYIEDLFERMFREEDYLVKEEWTSV